MKKFTMFFLAALISLTFAENRIVKSLGVNWLFKNSELYGTLTSSSVTQVTLPTQGTKAWVVTTVASSADSIISKEINTLGSGEFEIEVYCESVADTQNANVYLGVYKGEGIENCDAEGYYWGAAGAGTSLGNLASGTETIDYVHLSTEANRYKFYQKIKIKYVETGNQSNYLVVWLRFNQRAGEQ
jgi:hypothetical protein